MLRKLWGLITLLWESQIGAQNYTVGDLLTTGNRVAGTVVFDEIDDGNSGTTDTIDWTAGPKHKSTLTDNVTFTFTDPDGATNVILILVQDGTGSRLVTWPSTVKWGGGSAPTLTTTANAVDIISFYFDGTNYHGQDSLNFS